MNHNNRSRNRVDLATTLHLGEASASQWGSDPHRLKITYEGVIIVRLLLGDSPRLQDMPQLRAGVIQRWQISAEARRRVPFQFNDSHRIIEIEPPTND